MLKWVLCLLVTLIITARGRGSVAFTESPTTIWGWTCKQGACVQVRLDRGEPGTSLTRCQLTCGDYSSLWPYPTGQYHLEKDIVALDESSIHIEHSGGSEEVQKLLDGAINRFLSQIKLPADEKHEKLDCFYNKVKSDGKFSVQGTIKVNTDATTITMATDESYTLTLDTLPDGNTLGFIIEAETYFGARHGLETLGQMISFEEESSSFLTLKKFSIADRPEFQHRGLMLDTSRHFYPLTSLKRVIDGLSINKMNTFHWHLSDSQSFPVVTPSQPNMTAFGAYAPKQLYTPEDVTELVRYAKERGVRVLPELDTPYHTSHGFEWANEMGKGQVLLCTEEYYKKGHLSPVNDFTYELLGDLYKDFLKVFQTDVFHMGADEVFVSCWNSSQAVQDWIKEQGLDIKDKESFMKLWSVFQETCYAKLTEANQGTALPAIVWTSDLTKSENVEQHVDKDKFIIQVWTSKEDAVIGKLLSKGYKLIISNKNGLYLDCGFGTTCSPYNTWNNVYDNNPYKILETFGVTCKKDGQWDQECDQVLGSEACMWSEKVDAASVEMKIWPRVAALGERLWSSPTIASEKAHVRMQRHRERMVGRGIQADAVDPEWCNINETC